MLSILNNGYDIKRVYASKDRTKAFSYKYIKELIDINFLQLEYSCTPLVYLYEVLNINELDFTHVLTHYIKQYADNSNNNSNYATECLLVDGSTFKYVEASQ